MRVGDVRLERDETGVCPVALLPEPDGITAIAEQTTGTGHQLRVDTQLILLALAHTDKPQGDRRVLQRRLQALLAHLRVFLGVLEVHAEAELAPPLAAAGQSIVELETDRMAVADHIGSGAGTDLSARVQHAAVGLVAGGFQAPRRAFERHRVRGREHLGLLCIFRRQVHADVGAVPPLPQVVVGQRRAQAQLLGVCAVVVVE